MGLDPATNRSRAAPSTTRERVGRSPPDQPRDRELAIGRGDHQVAEPAAAQHRSLGDHAGVRELRAHRGHPAAGMRERRPVADVGRVDPRRRQRPGRGAGELHRGQVGRGPGPGEDVRDHHVKRPGPDLLQDRPGIVHPDGDPAGPAPIQRQPPPDEPGHLRLGLGRQLARAGPGRGHVPGQRQAAAAQMQHPQRLTGRRGQVDQVPQPAHVLELQVPRILEIDMGLRDAAHQQYPRGGRPRSPTSSTGPPTPGPPGSGPVPSR